MTLDVGWFQNIKKKIELESPLRGYNDPQGSYEGHWSIVACSRERNREPLGCLGRGVSNPREGSKIQTFLFRPRMVCRSPLHFRKRVDVVSSKFRLGRILRTTSP